MTAVLGIPCIDGVVLAADSQHSSNWYKENKNKLKLRFGLKNSAIAFSASGKDLYIENAFQDVGDNLDSEDSIQTVAASLQESLLEFHNKRAVPWSSLRLGQMVTRPYIDLTGPHLYASQAP